MLHLQWCHMQFPYMLRKREDKVIAVNYYAFDFVIQIRYILICQFRQNNDMYDG